MREDPSSNHDPSTVDILIQTAYIIIRKDCIKLGLVRGLIDNIRLRWCIGQLLEQFGQWNVNQYFTLTRIWSVVQPLAMKSENIQVKGRPILKATVQ